VTLDDLIARFDDVEETHDGVLVHCPAHTDSQASLRITVSAADKVLLRCRAGCETAAVVSALGLSMRDLATMTPGAVTFERATSQDAPAGAADVARIAADLDRWAAALLDPEGVVDAAEVLDYAERRFGIDRDDAARLGLGFWEDVDGSRLVVPFRDRDGVPQGYQARALDPEVSIRWKGPKNPEEGSWSKVGLLPGRAGWDEVVVTEGPGDGLTACALGYDAVPVRGAGLASNGYVVDQIAALVGDRIAVVAGDGDAAGRSFSATLAQALVERGVRTKVLDVPEGLDLSSWRERDGALRFGMEAVRALQSAPLLTSASAALQDRDEKLFPLTDLGNARFVRAFVEGLGSGVRFSPEAGFFLLDGGVWRPDKLDRARAHVQEAADLIAHIAKTLVAEAGDSADALKEAKRWGAWARHSQSSRGIDAALRELQALPEVAADVNAFDRHPDLLAVRNGVVDLRTGTLRPHDPGLLLTRRVDLDYDPAATCPRWERFLDEVFPAYPDLPAYVRRLVGYGITGSTAEQCFAVLWGTGANGKSVFTDTLTEVFRELVTTTPFSTFEERGSGGIPNDLAALKGARLVMAAEGEQGRPMAEAVLKRVTGRDLIAARYLRREFFEFRPTFLLLLATNFRPSFRGQDEGLWRRVKMIPWERYFAPAERDHRLGDALLAEAPGILTWAVRGAREWYAAGLQDPEVIRSSTKEYRETSDALAGFLPGVFVKDPAAKRIPGKDLFEAYLQWADEENLPARERWTRKAFFGAVEERGLVKRKTAQGVAFDGVRRAKAADHAEEERAAPSPLAHSLSDTPPTEARRISGADLDDVL
jgi:putative DNA primase/helicase